MSVKDDGGPAFTCQYQGDTRSDMSGITMRDYFAAKALGGMLADPSVSSVMTHQLAVAAYDYADAMLEARKQ